MKITTEIFYHYCPALFNPSKDLSERISSFIGLGVEKCRAIAGDELFDTLDNTEFDIKGTPDIGLQSAADAMMRLICLTAIVAALPSLDLVYTPTGFGVVSNSNLTPASSDRVNRLRADLLNQSWDAFDVFLSSLRRFEEWRTTPLAGSYFQSLFWRGRNMMSFGIAQPHRSDLINAAPEIHRAELVLKNIISPDQFDVFCRSIFENRESGKVAIAIAFCRMLVVKIAKNERFILEKTALLNFLESNPDEFPEYMNSREYVANHYKGYENRRCDSSFFFS